MAAFIVSLRFFQEVGIHRLATVATFFMLYILEFLSTLHVVFGYWRGENSETNE